MKYVKSFEEFVNENYSVNEADVPKNYMKGGFHYIAIVYEDDALNPKFRKMKKQLIAVYGGLKYVYSVKKGKTLEKVLDPRLPIHVIAKMIYDVDSGKFYSVSNKKELRKETELIYPFVNTKLSDVEQDFKVAATGHVNDYEQIGAEIKKVSKTFEEFVNEEYEAVGKYNTVKKVIKELGRRPSEKDVAEFIMKNYKDVTGKELKNSDPDTEDKIADIVAFYKFDIGDWEEAMHYAQNESVSEGKMPKKYIGNDEIVYLKSKEDSKGAHYNLYYKGHDIDTGGRRFGSEKELKDFADNYILSNQLYNKLRYEDSKPLPESLDEAKKFTYKNNIIKQASSKTSYAVVDNDGKEIETRLTLDDAKVTVDELNESLLNEANDTLGPKFVEEFLTNKRESFDDRFAFYGWVRKVLPTVYSRDNISYNDARSLAEKATKKYPEYKMSVVGGDKPDECQVWCNVEKVSSRREFIYDVLLGHATSMSDIDSMINNFESTIKKA